MTYNLPYALDETLLLAPLLLRLLNFMNLESQFQNRINTGIVHIFSTTKLKADLHFRDPDERKFSYGVHPQKRSLFIGMCELTTSLDSRLKDPLLVAFHTYSRSQFFSSPFPLSLSL